MPWLAWVQQLVMYQGVVVDHGYIPLHRIKIIGPLADDGETMELPDNVVPMKRPR